MSGYYAPGQPPNAAPSRPSSPNGPRMIGLGAMAVLLVATAVSFAVTRSSDSKAASAGLVPRSGITVSESGVTFPSTSDPASAASSTDGGGQASGSPVPATPTTIPTTPAPVTPAPRTTPPVQMSVYGVRNVLYKFFDGFLYHQLSDIRSAVCPKYRYLYNGTYTVDPKGYEIQRWHSNAYTLYPGRTYVDIYVAVTLRNPRTGSVGRTWNHTWVVILASKTYYVCGIRK